MTVGADPIMLVGMFCSLFAAMVYAVAAEIRTLVAERIARRQERGEPVFATSSFARLLGQLIELCGFGAGQWMLYKGLYGLDRLDPVRVIELTFISLLPLLASFFISTGTGRALRSYGPSVRVRAER